MRLDTLEIHAEECIGELLNAEHQLILALPRVAMRTNSPKLRTLVEEHLAETRVHATRLLDMARQLHLNVGARKSIGMHGILKEGDEVMGWGGDPALVERCILSASRKVEHYEIVAYESLVSVLEELERPQLVELATMTLDEEIRTDRRLMAMMSNIAETTRA